VSHDVARPARTAARSVGLTALVAASALIAFAGARYNPLAVMPLLLVLAALFAPRGSTLRTVMLAVAGVLVAMAAALVALAGVVVLALIGLGGGHIG
jgi:hypothetical protein